MNLYAYMMMPLLREVVEKNHINIPRERGYELAELMEGYTEKGIHHCLQDAEIAAAESCCERVKIGNLVLYEVSDLTNRRKKKYLKGCKKTQTNPTGIRWENIHGKLKKEIKLQAKHKKAEALKQCALFNKYAGKKGVLYIHARHGRTAWSDVHVSDFAKESWFLDGCDDWWDTSYCHLWAKVDYSDEFVENLKKELSKGERAE